MWRRQTRCSDSKLPGHPVAFLASAFTGHPIGFAAPRSQPERQHVEVCSLLPQRDCCRLSRHSLYSATKRESAWPSPEFKEPLAILTNRVNQSRERRQETEFRSQEHPTGKRVKI